MTRRETANERDEVLKRMLKMKPNPHKPAAAPSKKNKRGARSRRKPGVKTIETS